MQQVQHQVHQRRQDAQPRQGVNFTHFCPWCRAWNRKIISVSDKKLPSLQFRLVSLYPSLALLFLSYEYEFQVQPFLH